MWLTAPAHATAARRAPRAAPRPRASVVPMSVAERAARHLARVLPRRTVRRWRRPVLAVTRIVDDTVRTCMRHRITGLAAEAAYYALLSLPPLVLSVTASLGFVGRWWGPGATAALTGRAEALAAGYLTADVVNDVVAPMLDDVLGEARIDVLSFGFLLAMWSGSRVLNVLVDTVSIMYGLGGHRGIVRTRALSLTLYLVGLVLAVVVIPLGLIGPGLVTDALVHLLGPARGSTVAGGLYWPLLTTLTIVTVTTIYHVAAPVRTPWRRDLPGAVMALLLWSGTSTVMRTWLTTAVGGTSLYGPLATPIVVLIWLYALALIVLIGAALNAAVDLHFPHPAREALRGT